LKGVSVARRTLENPPLWMTSRNFASPACAPRAAQSPGLKFLHDPFQGGQPYRDEVVMVARPKETGDGAEHAARLVSPSNAVAILERRLHFGLIVQHCGHEIEAAHHVDGALLVCKHHGLLRRHGEFEGSGIIRQIVGSSLMR
jgi:hypothetical protein